MRLGALAWGLSLTGLGQWQLCSLALIWARSGGAGHLREGIEGALGEQDQPDLESGLALAYDGCSEQVSGRESGRLTQSSDPGLDWLWVWLLRAVGTRRTAARARGRHVPRPKPSRGQIASHTTKLVGVW